MFPPMKTQTFGVSTKQFDHRYTGSVYSRHTLHRREATENYKQARSNGTEQDSPARILSLDGSYSWDTPNAQYSKIRYTEGPEDKKWMEERDKNYLARLTRECELEATIKTLQNQLKQQTDMLQQHSKMLQMLDQKKPKCLSIPNLKFGEPETLESIATYLKQHPGIQKLILKNEPVGKQDESFKVEVSLHFFNSQPLLSSSSNLSSCSDPSSNKSLSSNSSSSSTSGLNSNQSFSNSPSNTPTLTLNGTN